MRMRRDDEIEREIRTHLDTEAEEIFQLVMPGEYPRARRLNAAYELADRLEALPGVGRAGFISMPPFTGQNVFRNLYLPPAWEAERDRLGEEDRTVIRGVSPGYLPALGARLLQGRWLEDRDGAGEQRVMLVNQSWVKRFSPDVSPVGTTVAFVTAGRERHRITWEVVGVVDDLRWRIDDGTAIDSGSDYPLLGFADLRQLVALSAQGSPDRPSMELDMLVGSPGGVGFALRVNADPLPATTLRSVARGIDAGATVDGVTTMSGVVAARRQVALLRPHHRPLRRYCGGDRRDRYLRRSRVRNDSTTTRVRRSAGNGR